MFQSKHSIGSLKFETKRVLAILKENRTKHKKAYEEAMVNYKAKVLKEFAALARRVKRGQLDNIHVSLPKPELHDDEYKHAIRMLELCVDAELNLDGETFSKYIEDEWDWSDMFASNTMAYVRKNKRR